MQPSLALKDTAAKLGQFVQASHKCQWQQHMAKTFALSTTIAFGTATVVLGSVLLVAPSPFAERTVPFFAAATAISIALYVYHQRLKIFLGIYLMMLYVGLACAIASSIGIDTAAMILCSLAIILASTLCGYLCALVPITISTAFLLILRTAELQGWLHPQYVLTRPPTDYSTVLLLAVLFHVVAAISSSLYRLKQTHRQLAHRMTTDACQESIRIAQVKQQKQKLPSAESQKMRQLYRLAEAGEVSTVLLHDLANNLTSLTFEIDELKQSAPSPAARRAKTHIRRINTMLNHARQRLQGEYQPQIFNLSKEICLTIGLLQTMAKKNRTSLEWVPPPDPNNYLCLGEPVLMQQLLTNIITNAVESYPKKTNRLRRHKLVRISLKTQRHDLLLTVTDWGAGIKPADLPHVFEPFYSTKPGGMGMGMYLTKRFIEGKFKGSISLHSQGGQTVCTVRLPQTNAPPS